MLVPHHHRRRNRNRDKRDLPSGQTPISGDTRTSKERCRWKCFNSFNSSTESHYIISAKHVFAMWNTEDLEFPWNGLPSMSFRLQEEGSTIKDKEKNKIMKGQSSHASWKSETEMQLRQTFDQYSIRHLERFL